MFDSRFREAIFGVATILGLFACKPGASSQPTASPSEALPWSGETSLRAGSVEGICGGVGAITADPFSDSWVFTGAKDICQLQFLQRKDLKSNKNIALGPIDDCGLLSQVGDLAASPTERPDKFYLMGNLSVRRVFDESGAVSFEGGTNNLLFQIDAKGKELVQTVDVKDTLRVSILEELRRWGPVLEEQGFGIQQDKRALVLGGLAAASDGNFLLGFTAPLICRTDKEDPSDCRAIVMLVSDLGSLFGKKPTAPEVKAHAMLKLGGAGLASLEAEPKSEGFLVSSTKGEGFLFRYKELLSSSEVKPLGVKVPEGATLRAVVPAPGGAAAFFTQDQGSCSQGRLSWTPIPLEALTF